MQSAVVVGLISILTGGALQEDIVSTVQVLARKGRDILDMKPGSETTRLTDENQNDFFVRNDCELYRISLVGSINVGVGELSVHSSGYRSLDESAMFRS